MIRNLFFWWSLFLTNFLQGQIKPWNINLEAGGTQITSINSKSLLCYRGQMGMEYYISQKINLGLFGQTISYYQNTDIANIDNKIIDLSSIEYNTIGISAGYRLQIQKIVLIPKMNLGYNFLVAKSLDFPTDKKEFLDYRYLSITPQVNLGYQISEWFTMGLNLGYNRQIVALKGKILNEFNPNSLFYGLFASIQIE